MHLERPIYIKLVPKHPLKLWNHSADIFHRGPPMARRRKLPASLHIRIERDSLRFRLHFLHNVIAQAPLPAEASVDHRVEFIAKENHRN